MSKKELLRRVEDLERRVSFLEDMEISRQRELIRPTVVPWIPPYSTGTPLPTPPYRVTCNESVSQG